MSMSTTQATLGRLKAMYASGDHKPCPEIYAADAVFDVNLPEWRFQLRGPDAIRHQLDTWHPRPPDLVEWQQRETSWGAVVELALWEGEDYGLYSRSVHVLDIDGEITRHVMYCIGDMTRDVYERSTAQLIVASRSPGASNLRLHE